MIAYEEEVLSIQQCVHSLVDSMEKQSEVKFLGFKQKKA